MRRSSEFGESLDYFHWKFMFSTSDKCFQSFIEATRSVRFNTQESWPGSSILALSAQDQNVQVQFRHQELYGIHRETPIAAQMFVLWGARFYEGDEATDNVEEFYGDIYAMSSLTSKAHYSYLPLIPRLRLLYANKMYAAKMCYPETLYSRPWADGVRDVWEGNAMREYKESGTCLSFSNVDG